MPLISRKEYAELCGDRLDAINVWINKRGKIVTVADNKKLIDTENPINAAFIQERQVFNAQKKMGSVQENAEPVTKISKKVIKEPEIVPEIPVKKRGRPKKEAESRAKTPEKPKVKAEKPVKSQAITPEKAASTAEIRQKERVLAEQNIIAKAKMDQEFEKKAQDIELQALRIQSEKIRLDKTAGNLLPIDLGMGVIERNANSILKTFEKGFERIADIYSNLAGFDPTIRADFVRECREELATCVDNAGKMATEEIDILVDNYAETLMTGQKKA